MLGRVRRIDFDDSDVSLLVAVTQLSERSVRMRLAKAHGSKLLRTVFANDWPWDAEALGAITVATADRAGLQEEISYASGLGERAVSNRLKKEHGKRLLANAFPELSDVEDDDERDDVGDERRREGERFLDGRSRFAPSELLADTRVVSVRRARAFVQWFAQTTGLDEEAVRSRLRDAHGRSHIETVFGGQLRAKVNIPPGPMLGSLTAAATLKSPSLVRWIADVSSTSPAKVDVALRRGFTTSWVTSASP